MHRNVRAAIAVLVLALACATSAVAADTDCPGSGAPCPYQGVSVLTAPTAGSPGSPTDAAVHPTTGDIYVIDRYEYRINQYDDTGAFIRSWGGQGSTAGELDQASGITIDDDGNLWVAEVNNNRISKFAPDGALLATFGGIQGSANNQLTLPEGVAIGPDDHIWIADTGNNRVVELAADGTFIRKFGSAATGPFGPAAGTAAGEFSHPAGIDVAANGDVWVADTFNNRLQRLPNGSSTWETIGANGGLPDGGGFVPSGSGPGEFSTPTDVEAAGGAVYATDSSRTQRLAAALWSDLAAFGGDGVGVGLGRIVVAQSARQRVRVLAEADGAPVAAVDPIEPPASEPRDPQGVATDATGHLYVADTDGDRVLKYDAGTGNFIGVLAEGQVDDPWGIATSGTHIFVADTGNNRIREFDDAGALVATYGQQGNSTPGFFNSPQGVAVAADGSLIVTDTGNNRIQRSNAARTSWTVIGGRPDEQHGSAAGEFFFPGDVAVTGGGDVWVADGANHRLQKLPSGSTTWVAYGAQGSGDGQFSNPRGIDVTPDGAHVIAADTNNARVQQISASTGAFEAKWGRSGDYNDLCPGEFSSPWGVAIDPDGNVIVSDEIGRRVTRFRFSGGSALSVCDRTHPALTLGTPTVGEQVSPTPQFTVSGGTEATDDTTVRVRVYRRTGIVDELVRTLASTDQTAGTWTVPWSGAALPDGTYTWEARQTDAHGNLAVSDRRTFVVGAGSPSGPALAVTELNSGLAVSGSPPGANPVVDDDTPTFSGTAENGTGDATAVTVRLRRYTGSAFVDDRTLSTTRDANGDWHVTPSPALAAETYEISVAQVTDSGTKTSSAWYLQVTALAVQQLNDGVPVVGSPPGANPVLTDHTPTFAGSSVVPPAGNAQITVHLDRYNGSSFVNDVRTFAVTANANGRWSGTPDPALGDETWRVRVTQTVSGTTRESAGWYFQLQTPPADTPLAITDLDGNAVSGTPPGANPVIFNSRPTIRGTASRAAGSVGQVVLHVDRNSTSGFVNNVVTHTIDRNASTGAWSKQLDLTDETYRVRVTQGGAESGGWYFQIKTDPPLAVTQIANGVPVTGNPPGSNPLLSTTTPTFKGTASIRPSAPLSLTVHLDRYNGTTFVPDLRTFETTRASDGSWSVTPSPALVPNTYQLRVTQGTSTSPNWWFQVPSPPAPDQPPTISIAAPLPGNQGHYKVDHDYASSFSCRDDRPPVKTCFGDAKINTATPGAKTFEVRAVDSANQIVVKKVDYVVEPKPANEGIIVQGIDVGQGTQTPGVDFGDGETRFPGFPFSVQSGPYQGVRLVKGKSGLARVFVETGFNRGSIRVLLYGFKGSDRKSLGTPLSPLPAPAGLNIDTSDKDKLEKSASDVGGFAFQIPAKWFDARLDLVAVAIPETTPTVASCSDCAAGNGFALTNITAVKTRSFDARFVRFDVKNGPPSVVDDMFRALELLPVPDDSVFVPAQYSGTLPNKTDYKKAIDDLFKWDQDQGANAGWDFTFGIVGPKTRNAEAGTLFDPPTCSGIICWSSRPVAVIGAQGRPLTAVGHETVHGFGIPHAGCGDKGEKAADILWPPDNKGYLHGVGTDLSAFASGNYVIHNGIGDDLFYDLMSYCAKEGNAWISPRNWEAMIDKLRSALRRSALLPRAGAKGLGVTATSDGMDVRITGVGTAAGGVGPEGSPVRALARDASGAVIANVPVKIDKQYVSHSTPSTAASLSTTIPAKSASVELFTGTTVLAKRVRSANAPKLRVTAPKAGAVVGRSPKVTVAWKGTDADGDPLTARVETSKDGGATWRTVSVGITASQMSLERNLFARSQRARVRVTVSDGWNETAATSKVFRSLGAPPAVVIRTPVPGATVAADGLVSLSGQGSDDSLKPLPGGSLRWFDGKRPLGRGATLDVRGLRAGVRTLRLRGRDAAGRLGSDTVRVKVKAVTPQLLSLKGPKKLGRKATKVRLRVAASVPATLKVRRQRFAVSRTPKVIRVKVKPGKGRLGLTLVLRAGKKSARSVLFIPR